jgi:pimeloyl-ACP methyl ester carboxylesterase
MDAAVYTYQSAVFHYRRMGSGAAAWICLHGYGEDAAAFHCLEAHLPAGVTLICIDLPFHGKTLWNETMPFTPAHLRAVVTGILEAEAAGPRFSLLGFSMGGRAALCLLQALPDKIEQVILLAPDGLQVNPWYWLATQTLLGNRFFRFTMRRPEWFMGLLRLLHKAGLVNQSIFKFVLYYIHNKRVREELYTRWTGMRKLQPALPLLRTHIRTHEIPVQLVYGRHDRIIRHTRGEKFRKGIENFCPLQLLDCGHQVLSEKNAAYIGSLLSTKQTDALSPQ